MQAIVFYALFLISAAGIRLTVISTSPISSQRWHLSGADALLVRVKGFWPPPETTQATRNVRSGPPGFGS